MRSMQTMRGWRVAAVLRQTAEAFAVSSVSGDGDVFEEITEQMIEGIGIEEADAGVAIAGEAVVFAQFESGAGFEDACDFLRMGVGWPICPKARRQMTVSKD